MYRAEWLIGCLPVWTTFHLAINLAFDAQKQNNEEGADQVEEQTGPGLLASLPCNLPHSLL